MNSDRVTLYNIQPTCSKGRKENAGSFPEAREKGSNGTGHQLLEARKGKGKKKKEGGMNVNDGRGRGKKGAK